MTFMLILMPSHCRNGFLSTMILCHNEYSMPFCSIIIISPDVHAAVSEGSERRSDYLHHWPLLLSLT